MKNTSVVYNNSETLRDKSLSNVTFNDNDIWKIIKDLDWNKIRVHDMINIRMLKICGGSLYKPFRIIFRGCLH